MYYLRFLESTLRRYSGLTLVSATRTLKSFGVTLSLRRIRYCANAPNACVLRCNLWVKGKVKSLKLVIFTSKVNIKERFVATRALAVP